MCKFLELRDSLGNDFLPAVPYSFENSDYIPCNNTECTLINALSMNMYIFNYQLKSLSIERQAFHSASTQKFKGSPYSI